jgi:hypothetical protein
VLRRVTLATPYGNPGCVPLSNPTKCRKLGLLACTVHQVFRMYRFHHCSSFPQACHQCLWSIPLSTLLVHMFDALWPFSLSSVDHIKGIDFFYHFAVQCLLYVRGLSSYRQDKLSRYTVTEGTSRHVYIYCTSQ